MNSVVDEVLAGSPRYNIKDNGGTTLYSNVRIDLATQVTTAGTPLNKALFDSIQTDLNSRLLASNKATTGEAQAGTNDTKYMTPAKVKQREQSLTISKSLSATGSATAQTLFDFSTASGNIIEISGQFVCSNSVTTNPTLTINGTSINGKTSQGWSVKEFHLPKNTTTGFYLRFDMNSKSYTGTFGEIGNPASTTSTSGSFDTFTAHFTALTTITAVLRGTSGQSSIQATIRQNY